MTALSVNKILAFAALVEVATGLTLIVAPSLVGYLLFGQELSGVAEPMGRLAGMGLLSLGIACWPGPQPTRAAICGMALYGFLVTLYLVSLGVRGEWVGVMLWPAVGLHTVVTGLLVRTGLVSK